MTLAKTALAFLEKQKEIDKIDILISHITTQFNQEHKVATEDARTVQSDTVDKLYVLHQEIEKLKEQKALLSTDLGTLKTAIVERMQLIKPNTATFHYNVLHYITLDENDKLVIH